ncbi:MAG: helix-turn-helix domain-containing protein [Alphaproteobacteria bacterium]|nr:helix-turn-helix domain-containing protein [Alphaproteobacteria bacterium]
MPKPIDHPKYEPLLVAPKDACILLGVGNTKLYELIKQRRLEVVKFGKATRITIASIHALASSIMMGA